MTICIVGYYLTMSSPRGDFEHSIKHIIYAEIVSSVSKDRGFIFHAM